MAGVTVKGDLTVERNARASRYAHGSVIVDPPPAGLTLNVASPYQIIVNGLTRKFITLPTVSTTEGADFGNGSEFRITNDMDPAADGAAVPNTVVLLAGGVQVGDAIGSGKTGIVFCKNAAATQQSLAWELVIIDEFANVRLSPTVVAIFNDPPGTVNPQNSWGLSGDGTTYIAQFPIPASKLPFPIITIKDETFHNILVDQFTIGAELRLSVTATPDARFAGRIEFA